MFAEIALSLTTAGWAMTTGVALTLSRRLRTDPLTGIGNRSALHRQARKTQRGNGFVGVLMIDLDHFKAINDTHGHDFGNKVLKAIATRLTETAHSGETTVRLHGDEFAVWLGALTSPARAEYRAHQVTQVLTVPLWIDGVRITAAGSVGLAVAPAATPLSDLLGQADQHMYTVKHSHRLSVLDTGRSRRTREPHTPDGEAA